MYLGLPLFSVRLATVRAERSTAESQIHELRAQDFFCLPIATPSCGLSAITALCQPEGSGPSP